MSIATVIKSIPALQRSAMCIAEQITNQVKLNKPIHRSPRLRDRNGTYAVHRNLSSLWRELIRLEYIRSYPKHTPPRQ